MLEESKYIYTVQKKVPEAPGVVTLKLGCDGNLPTYLSGQFITVYFADMGNAEGKAYTISSMPEEETLNITVKAIGQFSNKLCDLKVGDKLTLSLPYGYFYSESMTTPLVMIAGGIGVTPFRSIILETLKKYPTRPLILFSSNKNFQDTVFREEFQMLQTRNDSFVFKNYLTQQDVVPKDCQKGRVSMVNILDEAKKLKDPEFFICGSISFVRDFWKGLKIAGIPEDKIYTEAFF